MRAILHKWRKHGTVVNLSRSGRPTKITPRVQRRLIQEVTKDPTTTSKELQASLASVKVSVHDSTMVAQCVALLPHSKKVVGSSPASCNMSGLVPFCVEFACSPHVHPGSPHRTPTIKTCKKSRCPSVLSLTKSGPSTWTWSPAPQRWPPTAPGCPWGRMPGWEKSREHLPPSSHLHACVCVCVSPLTMCVKCVHAVWQ